MKEKNKRQSFVTRLETEADRISYHPPIQLDCKMCKSLVAEKIFSDDPIVIGDVGIGPGIDYSWKFFLDQCLWVGFEPITKSVEQIEDEFRKSDTRSSFNIRIENTGLWDFTGKINLHITRDSSCSSCFLPNKKFFKRLPDQSPVELVETIEIPVTTLDDYCHQTGLQFNVLNLDVQGGELAVLKGGTRQLQKSILAILVEVEFNEHYKGQPLFADIDQFMRNNGFALFDLDIHRWRRTVLPKPFTGLRVGQTMFADALYLRDPIENDSLSTDPNTKRLQLIKLAALAELFSLPDYAIEIVSLAHKQKLIIDTEKDKLLKLLNTNEIIGQYSRFESGWVNRFTTSH